MQTASFWIRTRVAESIPYDDNRYISTDAYEQSVYEWGAMDKVSK